MQWLSTIQQPRKWGKTAGVKRREIEQLAPIFALGEKQKRVRHIPREEERKAADRRRRWRREFRRQLALVTPLIDGPETREVAEAIGYDPGRARDIALGRVVPFDPRDSFLPRLREAL